MHLRCLVEDRVAFPLVSDDDVQRRRTTGDDERRMHLRCLVEDRAAFSSLPTNVDARTPLQGASTTTRARQSKEEERVIDRSTEFENLLWIDEPECHYDAETDVHSFNPRCLRRYNPERNRLLNHKPTPLPRSRGPDEYDPQSVMPWCCDSEPEVDDDFGNSLCDSESVFV